MFKIPKSNAVSVQEMHERCEKFLSFIKERYPQLTGVRFKLFKHGGYIWLRARYRRRQLYSYGMGTEYVMSRFLLEIMRKVYHEKYYEFRAELEAVRKLLQKRRIMNYFIYELKEIHI
ncbi:MAG: hypothetical protein LBQ28_09870 [Prevotellaceae bacterium]|jgi:hypothetical protein|nr:hypothetical protein [Prevotellaceae bacterium]